MYKQETVEMIVMSCWLANSACNSFITWFVTLSSFWPTKMILLWWSHYVCFQTNRLIRHMMRMRDEIQMFLYLSLWIGWTGEVAVMVGLYNLIGPEERLEARLLRTETTFRFSTKSQEDGYDRIIMYPHFSGFYWFSGYKKVAQMQIRCDWIDAFEPDVLRC
jgi:hypothetical protein